ncbi:DUF4011 domain-containing protein [Patescibacteria group bacterium]
MTQDLGKITETDKVVDGEKFDFEKIINKKLAYWKTKLIDLSKRNNLISYKFSKSKSIKIVQPSFKKVIEELQSENKIHLLREEKKELPNNLWLASEEEELIEKKLYNLYLKAKENYQELGVSTCFASLGHLSYLESKSSDQVIQAPIFLYPIELNPLSSIPKDKHRIYITTGSGDVQLNPALKEKLLNDFGIELEERKNEQSIKEYLVYFKNAIAGKKRWHIVEDVHIDIFSYQKIIMYEDLIKYEKLVKDSQLIKAYVGDGTALEDEASDSSRDEFVDTDDVEILPADSSQKKAIELAKSGVTFVLEGPPGTGKSQTISNIIAALIEKKKKILFVSQKMAALDVVKSRLDDVGLGRYCLNLHQYRGNKKEVINQLSTELNHSPNIQDSDLRYSYSNYLSAQKDLNEYYEYISKKHTQRSLSVYEIRGELAKLHDVEVLESTFNTTLDFDEEKFTNLLAKLRTLDELLTTIGRPFESSYFNYSVSKNTSLSRNKFGKLAKNAREKLLEILAYIEDVEEVTEYKMRTIGDLEKFVNVHDEVKKIDKKTPDYLLTNNFFEYKKVLNNIFQKNNSIIDLRKEILSVVNKNFLNDDTKHEKRIVENTQLISRLFNKEYLQAKKKLNSYGKKKLGHKDLLSLFEKKDKLQQISLELKQLLNNKHKLLARVEDVENQQELGRLCDLSEEYSVILKQLEHVGKKYRFKILNYMSHQPSISKDYRVFTNNRHKLDTYFDKKQPRISEDDISGVKNWINDLSDNILHLDEILKFKTEYLSLNKEARSFVKNFFKQNARSLLSSAFLKTYYFQLLEGIQMEENISVPKGKAELFRELDFEIRNNKRIKIMHEIEKEQPKTNYMSSGFSELAVLKRQAQKTRRLKPIRELLKDISGLVFTLKPCFMMSPLTVSQYIDPLSIKFDVVIFDEASQIMPEDAVTCLIRAKQAIVMGDTQQLPPTNFFMGNLDDENVDEDIEDLPSFLSQASTSFRSDSINWHYRSKNENLIAFSNRYFYEDSLITFPNSNTGDKSGLEFIHVKDGIYDRGRSRKNRIEAKKIVTTYRELKKKNPRKSFGIIAFSMAQENAIREAFQSHKIDLGSSIGSKKEELFVKNLETVQGDERDIIILSIGYGKDSSGKFSYNFGPLNKENGYKRLNVAITRSRFKTIIVSSIEPGDLDDDKIRVAGVRHLKNYLDYAKNKNFDKFTQTSEGIGFDSGFEEAVYKALTDAGYSVSSQVGCSGYRVDLAVKHPKEPGKYLLGIECDGAQYHSSKYARDRDKVRQAVLESLGWNIHRIWSDDWLNNREYELNKIKDRIDKLLMTKGTKSSKKKLNFQQ